MAAIEDAFVMVAVAKDVMVLPTVVVVVAAVIGTCYYCCSVVIITILFN